jgi:hypothetical protein
MKKMIDRATDIEYSQEFSLLKKSLMLWFNMSFSPRIKYGVNSSGNPDAVPAKAGKLYQILDPCFRRSDRPFYLVIFLWLFKQLK